eukprot:7220047-Pyramimonas_sp.AAC.1
MPSCRAICAGEPTCCLSGAKVLALLMKSEWMREPPPQVYDPPPLRRSLEQGDHCTHRAGARHFASILAATAHPMLDIWHA